MRGLSIILALGALAAVPTPVLAQHEGHAMPAPVPPPADPHAGHTAPVVATAIPGPVDQQAWPENAADAVWGESVMAAARGHFYGDHTMVSQKIAVEQLEVLSGDGPLLWQADAEAWRGTDIDKVWLKFEGEGNTDEGPDDTELQALWSHAIDPWFDLQTGVRQDFRPGRDRTHLAVGLRGLAPYWIEVDSAVFLSTRGEVTARIQAEHLVRITQRLMLRPKVELEASAQSMPDIATGSGLTFLTAGARAGYRMTPTVEPYVGVEWQQALGETRRLHRAAAENAGSVRAVAGLRFVF